MLRSRPESSEPPLELSGGWRSIEFQVTVALAAMLTPLNSTMLAVGLPSIRSHFDVGVGEMTLLISVYLVAVAAMQPVSGRLGDALGSTRVMVVGLVLLIAISAASTLAWSFPSLIVMRGLQGAATALVLPNGIAMLRKRTPTGRLGTVLGMNGAALSIAAATGPVIGGALLLAGDWRLLFLVNVPLSVVAIALLLRLSPDKGRGRRQPPHRPALARRARARVRQPGPYRERDTGGEPGVPDRGRRAAAGHRRGVLAAVALGPEHRPVPFLPGTELPGGGQQPGAPRTWSCTPSS